MSPLYLKLVALGVTGVTVATVLPISVIKSSSGNQVQAQQKLDVPEDPSRSRSDLERTEQEAAGVKDSPRQDSSRIGAESVIDSGSLVSLPSSQTEVRGQVTLDEGERKIDECKEVAKSQEGRLKMCYDKEDKNKVTFKFDEFFSSSSGSETVNTTHEVGSLFSYIYPKSLIVEVKSIDGAGKNNRSLLLEMPQETFSEKSNFFFSDRKINTDKCVVNWTADKSTGKNVDWKVRC